MEWRVAYRTHLTLKREMVAVLNVNKNIIKKEYILMFGHFGLFDVANIDIFSIRSKYFWIFYA